MNIDEPTPASEELPEERVSRTQRKVVLEFVRQLVEDLVEMTPGNVHRLKLPDELEAAVAAARRLTNLGARARQVRAVSRMIDEVDVKDIRDRIAGIDRVPVAPKPPVKLPPLVEQLLDGGDEAVFALTERYAHDDLQALRQAVRQARKQLQTGAARGVAAMGVASCLARLKKRTN